MQFPYVTRTRSVQEDELSLSEALGEELAWSREREKRNTKLTNGEEDVSEVRDDLTIADIFASAVSSSRDRPFFVVPPNPQRSYLAAGLEISYRDAAERIGALSDAYRSAGYGLGHRVATLLENRPEYVLHKFALNAIGVCCVPINPDYRAGEAAYLLEHSRAGSDSHACFARGTDTRGPCAEPPQAAGARAGGVRVARPS